MKKNRLLKIANLIENINPAVFDMDSWSSKGNECGTTFCVCGYAAHVGLFKGLTLEYDGDGDADLIYVEPGDECGMVMEDWDAVEVLFDLTCSEAEYLFYGKFGDTPHTVAERIRKFVKTGGVIEK